MSTHGKTRALAASLRLPNLPSVLSNTLTGAILAGLIFEDGELANLPLALLAASCLYFAGNLFNDWADRSWDQTHRPERALPSGVFQARHYLWGGITLTTLGLACALWASASAFVVSVTLALCIVIYTWSHKRTAWSCLPMASCRALLPVLGYCACSAKLIKLEWSVAPAALLFVYLIMLTLRARSESRKSSSNLLSIATAIGLMLPPVMLCLFWYLPHFWWNALLACLAASIPYLVWIILTLTIHRQPVSRQVSAMLAGIPLVDGLFLLPYFIMAHFVPTEPLTVALCYSWVAAFAVGRLLQRYVSAT